MYSTCTSMANTSTKITFLGQQTTVEKERKEPTIVRRIKYL